MDEAKIIHVFFGLYGSHALGGDCGTVRSNHRWCSQQQEGDEATEHLELRLRSVLYIYIDPLPLPLNEFSSFLGSRIQN